MKQLLVILLLSTWTLLSSQNRSGKQAATVQKAGENYFLVISDIHYKKDKKGIDKNDDCSGAVVDAALEKVSQVLKETGSKTKFILFLGDAVQHTPRGHKHSANTQHLLEQEYQEVFEKLKGLSLKYNIPVIAVPGNNDALDSDYGNNFNGLLGKYVTLLKKVPGNHISIDSNEKNLSCYSYFLPAGNGRFKVIELNSAPFSAGNANANAATEIFDWFHTNLVEGMLPGDQVIIAMHIPPGIDGFDGSMLWDRGLQQRFLDTISIYSPKISGLIAGHSHMDGFRLLQDKRAGVDSTISSLLLSAPGIDIHHGNNPAFKLVAYDSENLNLTDCITYYMPYRNGHNKWDSSYRLSKFLPNYDGNGLFQYFSTHRMMFFPEFTKLYMVTSPDSQTNQHLRSTITVGY